MDQDKEVIKVDLARYFPSALEPELLKAARSASGPVTADERARSSDLSPGRASPPLKPWPVNPVLRQIFATLTAQTRPWPFSEPWSFLAPTNTVRELRTSPAELFAALRKKFSDEILIRERVMTPGPNNEPMLAPALSPATRIQFVLDADRRVVDLATDFGALVSPNPPCFRFALKRQPLVYSQSRVLVGPVHDVQLLHRLKFVATTWGGLAQISGAKVRRLFRDQSQNTAPEFIVTLVGWHVSQLDGEMPDEVAKILRRFYDACILYEIPPHEFFVDVWMPTADEVERIRAAARLADRALVTKILTQSVERSTRPAIEAWQTILESEDHGLAAAFDELRSVVTRSDRVPRVSDARIAIQRARRAIGRITTRRFEDAAETATDGVASARWLLLRDNWQQLQAFHRTLAAAERVSRGENPARSSADALDFDEYERRVELFLKLLKLNPH